jgi:uncharacterized protein YprB with RNaseH-like and TPR domain
MIELHKAITLAETSIQNIEILCPIDQVLIFDIETTGFHRIKDHVIAITALYFLKEQCYISQWFAENIEEEINLLKEIKPFFEQKLFHITYNGNSFDIPFLNNKYQYYNISASINKSKCFDLYRFARKSLVLDSYKLKKIEQALGIERDDQISGKDCTMYYQEYLLNKDPALANLILQHNYEDVLNLVNLTVLATMIPDLEFNKLKILHTFNNNIHWYLSLLEIKGNFVNLEFWGFNPIENQVLIKSQSVYYSDGSALIVSKLNSNDYMIAAKLSIYEKEIDGIPISFFDLSNTGIIENTDIKSHQLIFKYNDLWVHSNILFVITIIFKYLLSNER